ncbi:NAD(P)-dependent dehydrogenase, short-chain alcohol dehydrogenase family [Salinibacillus kushneri]|uniref:NAD(P)-dependent dehydrogenase, short-chain alcohol dehydrogenase family n=1 Tax=Salinibacillus kushneri TaxID=237682 RepID=A0A1H9YDQ4_9BACI|nr:SDR family oxidoreductase [Salinibacillus kushneri]SES67103.1 NAD(P)-dependent dehydrogenase, short-chain alcohol dehydrogenase family [Salinibacillus kushneri]
MDQSSQNQPNAFPPQHQPQQPGIESLMVPSPIIEDVQYQGSGKLKDKVAIITGGDSGIGAAVAIAFAKEGAHVVIPYISDDENEDAQRTRKRVEEIGRECLLITGDLKDEAQCQKAISQTMNHFDHIDILVNNHAVQFPQKNFLDITAEQWDLTFKTNIYPFFYLTKAALPSMQKGAKIINTTSVVAYEGNEQLIDYTATKGAILGFTRALSQNLAKQGIHVNAVAPGPIWTPLIPSSFTEQDVTTFGQNVPLSHAGQPYQLAPAYVYLASDDSSYVSGQVIHVNGGKMVSS